MPFVLISITSTSYVLVCFLLDVVFDIILYLWLWLYFILKSDELLDKLLDNVCLSYLQYLTTSAYYSSFDLYSSPTGIYSAAPSGTFDNDHIRECLPHMDTVFYLQRIIDQHLVSLALILTTLQTHNHHHHLFHNL